MDTITPTMQAILNALRDGPATTDELKTRTGTRRRSTLDKAIAELNNARVIAPVPAGDGEEPRWTLPSEQDAETPDEQPSHEPGEEQDHDATDGKQSTDATGSTYGAEGGVSASSQESGQESSARLADSRTMGEVGPTGDGEASGNGENAGDGGFSGGRGAADEGQGARDGAEDVKSCAGCQAQMPVVCPCCQRKTTSYCGNCRRNMPTRRGAPAEPQILANGLPKLRPGQLEGMVLDVLRSNPLPNHLGIVGWTAGRVAVYLPGRSTGAIIGVLNKLANVGTLEVISEKPLRYQLTETTSPTSLTSDTSDDGRGQDTAEGVTEADAAASDGDRSDSADG
jgi:hypothetical protein